ncbi:MAG: ribulokinase [Candidatus Glassbacteria bacterium RIFCSPLOWO2_12_FULL_58_11]|uniref:Ribulokinase n=1 Tax=Candidatus Glassbacteria bacterium RIFCSPLOWO2_12_FULL_58_11 TaxID=1817867 RepID=A0A1F5Z2M6_9BACT|nr:MAG: ribulokinase [Candidatus Glassbacteria bacterium RIFCSPLOWO2_12_FULL_58_11]
MADNNVIGVDFGTDSVRVLIADTAAGEEISAAVKYFSRWSAGRYCDPAANRFRQHPLDHIEALEAAVREALRAAPAGTAATIRGIAVDTTGSTPGPVDRQGLPLGLHEEFSDNPNALFVLWKDHTAVEEAGQINHAAKTWGGTDFTMYEGGVYSSEWFWAKMLHILRQDKAVREAAWSWMENCDWIPALLCGIRDLRQVKRSRCAAGHKAMWHASFAGLPSEEFLTHLDPLLKGLRGRLYTETHTSDLQAGQLCVEWAGRLGLPAGIPVGVGAFDAHMGAVGAGIQPYILTKVIGTSTCDILVAPLEEMGDKLVRGICGQVDGSVIPGMLGMEAGQSAFGDVYAWFRDLLRWPVENLLPRIGGLSDTERERIRREIRALIYPELAAQAAQLEAGDTGIIALDWLNGRRTPDANQLLRGAITGLNLGSSAPRIFKALVEATAFGSRLIVERFEQEGVPIRGVIALGGVATQSPFAMQIVADVLNRRIGIAASEQACALGAAMFAAVVGGIYSNVSLAQEKMGAGFSTEYLPSAGRTAKYSELYQSYRRLGQFVESETGSVKGL